MRTYLPHLRVAPAADANYLRCLYTNTTLDSEDFLVGRLAPHLVVACGFGGEGFKFAPALGELLAELTLGLPVSIPEAAARFDPGRAL